MDIDGRKVANQVLDEIKREAKSLDYPPHLVFILVGEDPASQAYVRNKQKKCETIKFKSTKIQLKHDTTERELMKVIDKFNKDETVDGILVQMPLPSHIDEQKVIERVHYQKDVDGFHPYNVGKCMSGSREGFISCTPFGILKLLESYGIETSGKEVVVVGRSNIVGRPIANLLSQKETIGDATVTLAHSKTSNLTDVCRRADILIAAIGRAKMITADMVKEGAVVIDVGINRQNDSTLVGDVDYEAVKEKTKAITPVPGGVGPMTIAMLLKNTLRAAMRYRK